MKARAERFYLRHQCIADALPGDVGNPGNVVDRLFRVKLGALAADLVQYVDDVRLHIEQPKLEDREQTARPGADNEHVGFNGFTHA